MKLLAGMLLVLIASVGLALVARDDPGYVLISRGEWSAEMTLALFLVALVIAFILAYTLVRLVINAWRTPRRLRSWRGRRRSLQARRATARGFLELAEGHWKRAERDLTYRAEYGDTPMLNYLGAARAAQKLGADNRRDEYLALAHQSMPGAELAVGLTQAEVQLAHGQFEQALATLMHLRSIAPKHTHVLYLLRKLYDRLGSWSDLQEILPDLRRQKVLEEKELIELERKVHRQLLKNAGTRVDRLREAWAKVPKGLRTDGLLVRDYAVALGKAGEGGEAERVLREAISRHWQPDLVRLYGEVDSGNPARQLGQAESWLKGHEHSGVLLFTLGRLALRNELWGKARSYLEASVGVEPSADACWELGELLETLGESEGAKECFRRGLTLATGRSRELVALRPQAPAPAPAAVSG